jgi:hypothetical protein
MILSGLIWGKLEDVQAIGESRIRFPQDGLSKEKHSDKQELWKRLQHE